MSEHQDSTVQPVAAVPPGESGREGNPSTEPRSVRPVWSGKKSAMVAALAIGLSGAGAVAVAAVVPVGTAVGVGDSSGGGFSGGGGGQFGELRQRGQMPSQGGQVPPGQGVDPGQMPGQVPGQMPGQAPDRDGAGSGQSSDPRDANGVQDT